ncbi:MAG: non-canonical purine NTP pyrophosphatase [Deltaproteobacteria bacterium HGW-Deltaproteobacteria-4]|nr:MAG: non-canonical purine NTP pyrophosphatase [Deltaproteobacteria bacterium HGW-Deltaproteobacteria-4]
MELIVATRNPGKLKEIRALLSPLQIIVRGVEEFPELPEIVEDGLTFAENATKKAATIARLTGRLTLADDSGLEVAALEGAPGIHSARYAGEAADDAANNRKLLAALATLSPEQRAAAFVCVMALCVPDGSCQTFAGRLEGRIISELRGTEGFGYDPLFVVAGEQRTLAEIPLAEKNRISHRAQALVQVVAVLQEGRFS